MPILDDPSLKKFLSTLSTHGTSLPLAVFDCDGTVIKGDIGEAMLYHQIEHFWFRVSPAAIWDDFPRRRELGEQYAALKAANPDSRRRHPAHEPFAANILSWYFGQIKDGKVEKACADIVRLFAGYTAAEIRELAEATFRAESAAPLADRTLGGHTRPSGVRFIRESVEVLRALQALGFEVYAVSGSNRWSVESVFLRLGIPHDHVIGIDLELEKDMFTTRVIHPVPIREKKIGALMARELRLPVLVASDSRNDVPLLLYSAGIKLFVNSRRKTSAEFFESTGLARDESWVVIEHPTLDAPGAHA